MGVKLDLGHGLLRAFFGREQYLVGLLMCDLNRQNADSISCGIYRKQRTDF